MRHEWGWLSIPCSQDQWKDCNEDLWVQQANPITDRDVLIDSNNIDVLELQSVTVHYTADTTYNLWITSDENEKEQHTETIKSKKFIHRCWRKRKKNRYLTRWCRHWPWNEWPSAIIIKPINEQNWPFFRSLYGWKGCLKVFEIGGMCKKEEWSALCLIYKSELQILCQNQPSLVLWLLYPPFPSTSEHIPSNLKIIYSYPYHSENWSTFISVGIVSDKRSVGAWCRFQLGRSTPHSNLLLIFHGIHLVR